MTDNTPLDPNHAPLADSGSTDQRVDPLTGEVSIVVARRQGRPNLPDDRCPFCPGGIEAPDPYDVRWFANRWPPLPNNCAEVVLYTDDHDATFASLGVDGARRVVDLWAERSAALGARRDVAYVLVFENRGPAVGATIAHPHGQIYAFDHVPPRPAHEFDRATDGTADAALGRGATGNDDELLVVRTGGWQAWVPWAATWPYEMVVAPLGYVADLPSLSDDQRHGLATTLTDALGRLDALFDAPMPYMLWFHQRPFDGVDRPALRLHAHITPLWRSAGVQRFVAAAELGAEVFFNPVDPIDAAANLRAAGR
jgi:UDPglucose--hexose-1-phosphate uridylyltransferase